MADFTNLTKQETLNFLLKLLQTLRVLKTDEERVISLQQLIINIAGLDDEGLLNLNDEQYDIFIGDTEEDNEGVKTDGID